MTRDWMKLQKELNENFQKQLEKINSVLKVEEELESKIQKQVAELESIMNKMKG